MTPVEQEGGGTRHVTDAFCVALHGGKVTTRRGWRWEVGVGSLAYCSEYGLLQLD